MDGVDEGFFGKLVYGIKVVVPGLALVGGLAAVLVLVPAKSERVGKDGKARRNPAGAIEGGRAEDKGSNKSMEVANLRFPAPRVKDPNAFRSPSLIGDEAGAEEPAGSPDEHRKPRAAGSLGGDESTGRVSAAGGDVKKPGAERKGGLDERALPGGADPLPSGLYEGGAAQCSGQGKLVAEGARAVRERLSGTVSPPLPEPEPARIDWKAIGHYFKAMLRPVPKKPSWARSLRAFRHARVHYAPDLSSDEVGLLSINSRVPPYGFVRGRGCRGRWVAVGPHAYVCRRNFVWDKRKPRLVDQPPMKKGAITPGRYAYVRKGGAPVYSSRKSASKKEMARKLPTGFFVRFKRFVRIGDENYWKTTKNWYIPVDRLARHVPSEFGGLKLDSLETKLPVAFLWRDAKVYDEPGGTVVDKLAKHSAVRVLGKVRWGKRRFGYFRIGECRWVRSSATRPVWPTRPPPGVKKGEQWIDIHLKNQTLVAYEGRTPVFATIVSTGDDEHPTQHGIFRVYWKVTETDMTSDMGAEDQYMAESVPWSLFFWKGQALHGAYWHDSFGVSRSHGCVNLSPKDARFVHEWSKPSMPRGWIYRWFGDRFPGILVRVRRHDDDLVRYLGFARKFAPSSEVEARDTEFRRRIQQETIRLLEKSRQEGDGDEGDEHEQGKRSEEQ
jgi:hypothetical protein